MQARRLLSLKIPKNKLYTRAILILLLYIFLSRFFFTAADCDYVTKTATTNIQQNETNTLKEKKRILISMYFVCV